MTIKANNTSLGTARDMSLVVHGAQFRAAYCAPGEQLVAPAVEALASANAQCAPAEPISRDREPMCSEEAAVAEIEARAGYRVGLEQGAVIAATLALTPPTCSGVSPGAPADTSARLRSLRAARQGPAAHQSAAVPTPPPTDTARASEPAAE